MDWTRDVQVVSIIELVLAVLRSYFRRQFVGAGWHDEQQSERVACVAGLETERCPLRVRELYVSKGITRIMS